MAAITFEDCVAEFIASQVSYYVQDAVTNTSEVCPGSWTGGV